MCVSPTFASPIEKAATSTHRRICREIIGNTEGNAKTVDSLQHCKWTSSTSKSDPKTKKNDQKTSRWRILKMVEVNLNYNYFSPSLSFEVKIQGINKKVTFLSCVNTAAKKSLI